MSTFVQLTTIKGDSIHVLCSEIQAIRFCGSEKDELRERIRIDMKNSEVYIVREAPEYVFGAFPLRGQEY